MAAVGLRRRVLSTIALVLAASLPTTGVEAGVTGRSTYGPISLPPEKVLVLQQLQDLGVPASFIQEVLQTETFTGTFTTVDPAKDLDRDGREDALVVRWEYEVTFTTFPLLDIEIEGESFVTALSGDDGDIIWRKHYKDSLAEAVPLPVGSPVRHGVVILDGITSLIGPYEDRYLILQGLDGKSGKSIWKQEYRSHAVEVFPTYSGTGVPLSLGLFDGLPGRAEDIVIGIGEVASAAVGYVIVSQVHVTDGGSGEETIHPSRDVGVSWDPSPFTVGDLDGDGLDDYVVVVSPSPDASGQNLSVTETTFARKGTDGSEIWNSSDHGYEQIAWPYDIRNVAGGAASDIGIATLEGEGFHFRTIVLDGNSGATHSTIPGGWPFSPGDIDGDGHRDVIGRSVLHNFGKGVVHYTHWARRGGGSKIWDKRVSSTYGRGLCTQGCSTGIGSGWHETGDVDRDGLLDTFAHHSVSQTPGGESEYRFITSGRTGKVLVKGGEELLAADTAIDGRGVDILRVNTDSPFLEVGAEDPVNGKRLWTTTATLALGTGKPWAWSASWDRGGDRCGDVLLAIDGGSDAIVVALDGADGSIVWWKRTSGDVARLKPLSTDDQNTAC